MRPITKDQADKIKSLLLNEKSCHFIASYVGVSLSTVVKFRKELDLNEKDRVEGRPKLMSQRLEKFIVRCITIGEKENAVQVKKELLEAHGIDISPQTVRRILQHHGLVAFVKPKKPVISEINRKKRLEWALDHVD